jgi:hypothetical protein
MSRDVSFILEVIPRGAGFVLDLGGGTGMLRQSLQRRGHRYIKLHSRRFEHGEPSLIGDAYQSPFKDAILDMVGSKDTLEHFLEPWVAVAADLLARHERYAS